MKLFSVLFSIVFILQACKPGQGVSDERWIEYDVPLAGNGWFSNDNTNDRLNFGQNGLTGWKNGDQEIWIYFKVDKIGVVQLALDAKTGDGNSELSISLNGDKKMIDLSNNQFSEILLGRFKINNSGYQKVVIKGVSKSGVSFADIRNLKVTVPKDMGEVTYVKDDFYWGRRGPSVHLSYTMPDHDVRWLYNEITVTEENDIPGSYFMANGFAEGYFGIQVNSLTERRVLFSVWSPYETDDPDSIPDDQKIVLLKKGENVNTGEFGNEGSGGQSFMRFNWVTGHTYKFLTRIEPSEVVGSTEYTSFFYAPESGEWQLIASFRRPVTITYAKRFHSFLENFITGTGNINRTGQFSNQWVCDVDGNWTELTKAKFTADATARKGNRLDYAGRAVGQRFELSNCGFFWPNVDYDTFLERQATFNQPDIDWQAIEKL